MYKYLSAVVLAMAVLLTACTATKVPKRLASEAEPSVTIIRLAVYGRDVSLDPVIAAFEESHPQYRVEKVSLTQVSDIQEKLKNGEADLVPSTDLWTGLAQQSLLANLEPFIASSRFDTAPFGQLLANLTLNGRVYALPLSGTPSVFVYNKQIVKDAGISVPTDKWTWDQFRETAQRLTQNKGGDRIWGFDWAYASPEDVPLIHALQATAPGAFPDSKTTRDVLTFWNVLINQDHSAPPVKSFSQRNSPPVNYFARGQAAIAVVPLSALLNGKDAASYGLLPYPTVPGAKPVAVVALNSYSIAAKSTAPEAAWAFLAFASGPDGAAIRARTGQFPVYASEATRKAWSESASLAGRDMLFSVRWVVPTRALRFEDPYSYGAFLKAANDVMSRETSVDSATQTYEWVLARAK